MKLLLSGFLVLSAVGCAHSHLEECFNAAEGQVHGVIIAETKTVLTAALVTPVGITGATITPEKFEQGLTIKAISLETCTENHKALANAVKAALGIK